MGMEKDAQIPILLGRPFLATTRALIYVKKGKLTFKVGDKKIKFIPSKFMKNPSIGDSYCQVHVINDCVGEHSSKSPLSDGLEVCLTCSINHGNKKVESYRNFWLKITLLKIKASNCL